MLIDLEDWLSTSLSPAPYCVYHLRLNLSFPQFLAMPKSDRALHVIATALSWAIPGYWAKKLKMCFLEERMSAAENTVFIK